MPHSDDDYDDGEESARPVTKSRRKQDFAFHGTAGSFFVVSFLSQLLIMFTLMIGTPWAVCMQMKWMTENTTVDGRRLRFTGNGGELFGQWIKWFFFLIITLSIYQFWMYPAMFRWIAEHIEFDDE